MVNDREDADAYDAALSRLLDGLGLPEATDPAEEAANAAAADDVARIARALRMIGAEAAGEPAVAGSAAADVAAAAGAGAGVGFGTSAGSGVDARLVPFRPEPLRAVPAPLAVDRADELAVAEPSNTEWWRKSSARVLTAAASVAVIALGVAVGQGAGSNNDSGAVAQQAPAAEDTAGKTGGAPRSGQGANELQDGVSGAAATSGAYSSGAAAADSGAAAPAAPVAPVAPVAAKAAKAAARKAPFATTVRCSRAIVAGEVASVGAAKLSSRATWAFTVSEWVSPSSGPASATYVVGGRKALMPDGNYRTLTAGTTGLFLVPAERGEPLYAWTGGDVQTGRAKIDAALAKGSSASC